MLFFRLSCQMLLIFSYLAFNAVASASTASGGTPGKQQTFVHVCVVLNLCAIPACMSWIHLVYPHCTYAAHSTTWCVQGLSQFYHPEHPKAWLSRSHACKIVVQAFPERAVSKSFPFSSQWFTCAPPGSTRKPWHYCLASALLLPCCLC
jgi:hypothetical protein